MKRLIYQVSVGKPSKLYKHCINSVSEYCDKHDIEQKIERELLMRRDGISTVTLGPRVLLASHCIVLAHAALDNVDRTYVE